MRKAIFILIILFFHASFIMTKEKIAFSKNDSIILLELNGRLFKTIRIPGKNISHFVKKETNIYFVNNGNEIWQYNIINGKSKLLVKNNIGGKKDPEYNSYIKEEYGNLQVNSNILSFFINPKIKNSGSEEDWLEYGYIDLLSKTYFCLKIIDNDKFTNFFPIKINNENSFVFEQDGRVFISSFDEKKIKTEITQQENNPIATKILRFSNNKMILADLKCKRIGEINIRKQLINIYEYQFINKSYKNLVWKNDKDCYFYGENFKISEDKTTLIEIDLYQINIYNLMKGSLMKTIKFKEKFVYATFLNCKEK